jgi:hypothetical protein
VLCRTRPRSGRRDVARSHRSHRADEQGGVVVLPDGRPGFAEALDRERRLPRPRAPGIPCFASSAGVGRDGSRPRRSGGRS